jgi:hypothetical protein
MARGESLPTSLLWDWTLWSFAYCLPALEIQILMAAQAMVHTTGQALLRFQDMPVRGICILIQSALALTK